MPSFGKSFPLNALPSWLSGSSTAEKAASDSLAVNNATLQDSSDRNSGRQYHDRVYENEYAVTKVMQAAGSLGPGSTEYFDAVSVVYNHSPSEVARGRFLKDLIGEIQEQNWIGLDLEKRGGIKVVDYGAGTGTLSHALAPHVTKILAIDKSPKMVERYNQIVAKENKTKCEMKAVLGDMTSHFLSGKKLGIEKPDGVFAGFDMVAMCLAVDFFTHEDVDDDAKHEELVRSLDVMVDLINKNGTLLIIDVEKCDEDCYPDLDSHSPGAPHEGLKVTGHGSKAIAKALRDLGMEKIAIIGDQHFLFEAKQQSGPDAPALRRKETYFVLKAKRGPLFEKRLRQTHEGFEQ